MDITREALLQLIESQRKKLGLSRRGVAIKAGIPPSQIYDLFRGVTQIPRGDRLQKILSALGVSNKVQVAASGKIHSGGSVTLYNEMSDSMDEIELSDLPPGVEFSSTLTWFEVADNRQAPVLFKGWQVWVDDFIEGYSTDLTSDVPHYVKIRGGSKQFAIIRKGYAPGRFNLLNLTRTETIEDAQIEWCYRVKAIVPR